MPRKVASIRIPLPDPDTSRLIDIYARRRNVDRTTAAEHLITYGARAWMRAYAAGKIRASADTRQARQAWGKAAAAARWGEPRERNPPLEPKP